MRCSLRFDAIVPNDWNLRHLRTIFEKHPQISQMTQMGA
jgi:hypothetical protein